jgi:peptidoglycan/xylan/chitin deacetylase (PgdA/CDA1 family)
MVHFEKTLNIMIRAGEKAMKRQFTAILLICLGLTGCTGDTGPALPKDAAIPLPDVTVAPKEQPTAQEPAPAPPAEQTPVEEQPKAAEPQPAVEPPVSKDYYMDKNYMIKPKEKDGNRKVALLTFDDGPKEEALLSFILETLDKHNAKAIFFVNGYRAKQKPELLKQMDERGHSIGNHSWDHIDLKKQSKEEMHRQLEEVQTLVTEITGKAPVFFRPPFGSGGDAVRAKAAEEGMLYMTWSNGSRDWVKGYNKPEKVIESVVEQLHPGSNILMHELPWTAEGLDELLSSLEQQGYSFIDPERIDPAYSKN